MCAWCVCSVAMNQSCNGGSGADQPQTPPAPPPQTSSAPGVANDVLRALARAVSVPLATVIFQALMGSPPAPQSVPSAQPLLELSQVIQRAFQSGSSSPGAVPPQVNSPYSPGVNQGRGKESLQGRGRFWHVGWKFREIGFLLCTYYCIIT